MLQTVRLETCLNGKDKTYDPLQRSVNLPTITTLQGSVIETVSNYEGFIIDLVCGMCYVFTCSSEVYHKF